jgi:hypothetical protein
VRLPLLLAAGWVALVLIPWNSAISEEVVAGPAAPADLGPYVLIGWNDLGMHCSNKLFADLAVLPPFNTVWATLIRRGDWFHDPEVLGPGYTATYHFEDNTYSVGKTDFWSHEDQLFGVDLPDNVGLTGKGLTGTLDVQGDHFAAVGIPLTPFDDADLLHEQPFQLGHLNAYDALTTLIATTEIVVPVSNEMTCSACHYPEGGGTVDRAILRRHDDENGTNLLGNRPILCATCHASNALGMPGLPELPSLSKAMHEQHAEDTDDCYKCHPGPNTQCLRDVMAQQHGMVCQDCHGHMIDVAESIEEGREPWLEEPRCGGCHGGAYAEAPGTLYRNSNNGHGGLYCPVCHGSPHAILPSREERDNRQNIALQEHEGTLDWCVVCHGHLPWAPGPHGLYPTGFSDGTDPEQASLGVSLAPNPSSGLVEVRYRLPDAGPVRLSVFDLAGREVRVLASRPQSRGDHTLVWDGRDGNRRDVPSGVYLCSVEAGGERTTARLVWLGR